LIIIISAGYIGTEKNLLNKLDIEQNKKNNVMTLFQYSTNNKKIFAAGDCRIGQSLVVNAIDEGRRYFILLINFFPNYFLTKLFQII
jgi:glutamate synthase (NADPH/NADH) small chain